MRIHNVYGSPFFIRGDRLIEPMAGNNKVFRSVSRQQVAEAIRGKRTHVDGKYRGHPVFENVWLVSYNGLQIAFGCQIFSGKSLIAIRKWALRRKS